MPGMAARIGDQTSHGGSIIGPGVPMVLIGGKPAAVLGDMQVCPLVSGTVPHASTPFLPPGSPMVLIGGKPALTQGNATPPPCGATILMGCPTVIIGTNPPVVAPLVAKMATGVQNGHDNRNTDSQKQEEKKGWLELELKDNTGEPVGNEKYRVQTSDGEVKEGFTDGNGFARIDNIAPGSCKVGFPNLDETTWRLSGV